MKMIWAPSQVIREGRDLNQQGQAARQEQASSSSPVTFHFILACESGAGAASAATARRGASIKTAPAIENADARKASGSSWKKKLRRVWTPAETGMG